MDYPEDIDPDCVTLCDALNACPGIKTFESCCGHRTEPFRVWFTATIIDDLRPILMAIQSPWHIEVGWANGGDVIYFMLEGPIGTADAPQGADALAERIKEAKENLVIVVESSCH